MPNSTDVGIDSYIPDRAGSIRVGHFGSNMQIGYLFLPLTEWLIISSNDIPAIAVASKNGGKLASDTAPALARVNGATDKQLRLTWAATSVIEIQQNVMLPPDLDPTKPITFHLKAAMEDVNDTPTVAIAYFEGVGDTNAGGNTAAVTGATVADYTVSIATKDIGGYPNNVAFCITPGSHDTDKLYVYQTYITYSKRA